MAPPAQLGFLDHNRRAHAHAHTHTLGGTPLNWWSAPVAEAVAYKTQEKNIHALSEIRTRDPRKRAAADLSVRPHYHQDRLPAQILSDN